MALAGRGAERGRNGQVLPSRLSMAVCLRDRHTCLRCRGSRAKDEQSSGSFGPNPDHSRIGPNSPDGPLVGDTRVRTIAAATANEPNLGCSLRVDRRAPD